MPGPSEEAGEGCAPKSEGFHELVRRAQAGDRGAMDCVLRILRPHLEYLAHSFSDPAHPAESTADLLQEACLRAWRKLKDFRGGKNDEETFAMFRAWIGQIVKRLGLNSWRDSRRQRRSPPERILSLGAPQPTGSAGPAVTAEAVARDPTPSEYLRLEEVAHLVQAAVKDLPNETDAAIIRMRFFDGLTLDEICGRLGLGYNEVRNRYRATSGELQRKLRHLDGP